jgi:hypothetical protein
MKGRVYLGLSLVISFLVLIGAGPAPMRGDNPPRKLVYLPGNGGR